MHYTRPRIPKSRFLEPPNCTTIVNERIWLSKGEKPFLPCWHLCSYFPSDTFGDAAIYISLYIYINVCGYRLYIHVYTNIREVYYSRSWHKWCHTARINFDKRSPPFWKSLTTLSGLGERCHTFHTKSVLMICFSSQLCIPSIAWKIQVTQDLHKAILHNSQPPYTRLSRVTLSMQYSS